MLSERFCATSNDIYSLNYDGAIICLLSLGVGVQEKDDSEQVGGREREGGERKLGRDAGG